MKKLLGIIEYNNEERFLFQENGSLTLESGKNFIKPKNYTLIKNRDKIIGNNIITGDSVFNFRYGPVTGGVAEAGIYNIYTTGEKILSVKIDVSIKKRNIETLIKGKEIKCGLKYAESVCSNFAFSHSLAFARTVEKIFDINVEEYVKKCRIIALELERIYNHLYVIGELAKGAAQKVLTSHIQYLFEEMLRINQLFSGSRHLLNFNTIGDVLLTINSEKKEYIIKKLLDLEKRFEKLLNKSLESGNYLDRLHNTGVVTNEKAIEIGLTGPSLRASGSREDLRECDNYYNYIEIPLKNEGDSLSRMEVRGKEILISLKIIKENLKKLYFPSKKENRDNKVNDGEGFFGIESPSGSVCYFLSIKNRLIDYCYIVTPSLFGFKAIADSLAGQIFTDFVFTVESFGVNFADAAR